MAAFYCSRGDLRVWRYRKWRLEYLCTLKEEYLGKTMVCSSPPPLHHGWTRGMFHCLCSIWGLGSWRRGAQDDIQGDDKEGTQATGQSWSHDSHMIKSHDRSHDSHMIKSHDSHMIQSHDHSHDHSNDDIVYYFLFIDKGVEHSHWLWSGHESKRHPTGILYSLWQQNSAGKQCSTWSLSVV